MKAIVLLTAMSYLVHYHFTRYAQLPSFARYNCIVKFSCLQFFSCSASATTQPKSSPGWAKTATSKSHSRTSTAIPRPPYLYQNTSKYENLSHYRIYTGHHSPNPYIYIRTPVSMRIYHITEYILVTIPKSLYLYQNTSNCHLFCCNSLCWLVYRC